MKRFLCLLIVISLSVFIFSQEIEYRCIENTYGSLSKKINEDGTRIVIGDIISLNLTNPPYFNGEMSAFYGTCKNGDEFYFKLDAFEIVGSDKLPGVIYDKFSDNTIQSVEMIASYYFDILKRNDISAIYEYEPFWKDDEYISPMEHFSDYYRADRYLIFSNTRVIDTKRDCRPSSKEIYLAGLEYSALVKEIKKLRKIYIL